MRFDTKLFTNSNAQYKPAAIRAFYFTLALNLNYDRDRDAFVRNLEVVLDSTFDLNHTLALTPAFDLDLDRITTLALALVHDLDLNLTPELNLVHELDRTLANLLQKPTHTYGSKLMQKLQQLRQRLPIGTSRQNLQNLRSWWLNNGQGWTRELRELMIMHCNIGHDWQFTQAQRNTLRQYYELNKFLVELSKLEGAVSEFVQQEIEDNLMLPIAELKRRLPDLYE